MDIEPQAVAGAFRGGEDVVESGAMSPLSGVGHGDNEWAFPTHTP